MEPTHQHIVLGPTDYVRCYPTTGPGLVAEEAKRLRGTVVTVQDIDCANGLKPEYIAWKARQQKGA